MRIGNSRRHARVRYTGAVRLAWDEHGVPRYALGKCVDLSSNGLRVEAPVGIPVGSRISLRIDELKVSAAALLKNVSRRGSKSLMGLELGQALHEKVLAAITQAPAQANGAPE
jgi:hypothetical protein